MKHGEVAVGRPMHVEFDNICTSRKGCTHRIERVLQVRVLRRKDAWCRAGISRETGMAECLCEPAMSEQQRFACVSRRQQARVVEIDKGRESQNNEQT